MRRFDFVDVLTSPMLLLLGGVAGSLDKSEGAGAAEFSCARTADVVRVNIRKGLSRFMSPEYMKAANPTLVCLSAVFAARRKFGSSATYQLALT